MRNERWLIVLTLSIPPIKSALSVEELRTLSGAKSKAHRSSDLFDKGAQWGLFFLKNLSLARTNYLKGQ